MAAPPAPAVVDVVREERYWYPDDGGQVWVAGFTPVDAASGRYLGRAAPELATRGLRVVSVAGARHQGGALDDPTLAPGAALALRRDPANAHDANAIALRAAGPGGVQAGWIPRELESALAPALDAGEGWTAVVLRESRPSPRDPRTGLVALLAPAPAIELRVRSSRG